MSQIPNYGGGFNAPRQPRRLRDAGEVQQVGGPGFNNNTIYRGPTTSSGARMAAELSAALGGAGQVIGQLGAYAAADRRATAAEDARKNAENNQVLADVADRQKNIDATDRVASVHEAANLLPGVIHDIAAGNYIVPAGMKLEDFAHELTSTLIGPNDQSEEYTKTFRAAVQPKVTEALHDYHDKQRSLMQAESLAMIADSAKAATDQAGIHQSLEDARRLLKGKVTETDILSGVLVPAIEDAAVTGTKESRAKLDEALKELGDRLPDVRRKAEATFAQASAQHQQRAIHGFQNDIAALYNADTPRDLIEQRIRQYEARKVVPATAIDAQLEKLDNRFAEQKRQAEADLDKADFDKQFGDLRTQVSAELDAGDLPGRGIDRIPESATFTLPSGKTVPVKGKDMIDLAVGEKFAQIDAQYPPNKPDSALANLNARMDVLRKAPTATDPSLERKFTGLSRTITDQTTAQNAPRLIDALNTYMHLSAYPAQRDAHVKSPDDRALLDAASHIMQTQEGIAPIDAIKAAFINGRRSPDSLPPTVGIDEAKKYLPKSDIQTTDSTKDALAQILSDRARTLQTITPGLGRDQALKLAATQVQNDYTTVNGQVINKRGRPVVNTIDFPAVTSAVVGAFLASHPREGGEDASRGMVIRFNAGDPQSPWRITDLVGRPVMDSPSLTDFDLATLNAAILNQQSIADYPKRNAEYQAKAASEATGGLFGKIGRAIDVVGSAIGGVEPTQFKPAPTIPPLDKPVEIVPHDPSLQPIIDWIKKSHKAEPPASGKAPRPYMEPKY